ncbi:MAG: tRNA lysidine(34) synthetase TilS [Spirochaetes bacterium]|nr:tRNA lysidine(34) synthetase TilS [Spirochaetota bacterium]
MKAELEKKVLDTINKYKLVSEGDKILVSLSGGVDSVVLLNVLDNLKAKLGIQLGAIHINHLLRHLSSRDELFCINLCNEMGIPCFTFRKNVREFARENNLSIEEAGRIVRYSTIRQFARENGFTKIATAHHIDDNIETLFLRIFKGTSLKGLLLIRPKFQNIIRPLIEITKYEIIEYAKEQKLSFIIDETNYSNEYERNYVRNIIIPTIYPRFPNFREKIYNLISDLRDLYSIVEMLTKNAINQYVVFEKDSAVINLKITEDYPKIITREVVKKILSYFKTPISRKVLDRISYETRGYGNKVVVKFKNIIVLREYDKLRIKKIEHYSREPKKTKISEVEFISYFDVDIDVCELDVNENFIQKIKTNSSRVLYFDLDGVKKVEIRRREKGDYIKLDFGNKKIKDILIDEKIPLSERDKAVVVDSNKGIVGIYYGKIRVASNFLLKTGHRKVCRIRFNSD